MKIQSKLYLILPAIFLILILAFHYFGMIVNLSSSMPIGLYRKSSGNITNNDYVALCLDSHNTQLGISRGYLEKGTTCNGSVPLIKKVIALPNESITLSKNYIITNHHQYNLKTLDFDNINRQLGSIKPGKYQQDCYWLIGDDDFTNSWDSRYWGCIKKSQILYMVVPLIIWK